MDFAFYSAARHGFFDPVLHAAVLPVDAVQVTAAEMRDLFEGQANGARIVPGPGGAPVLEYPAAPTAAQVLAAWRAATSVSAFQAKAALYNRGKLDDAEAVAVAAGGLTLLAWQTATSFQRLSPSIISLTPAIGITDPLDLDELFREAALISA